MKNKSIFFSLFLIIISLTVGFFVGLNYQKTRRNLGFNQESQFNFQRKERAFNQGNRPFLGEIIKKDSDSLTIKLRDGSTKLIFLTEKTSIIKAAKGNLSDLKEKENVFIFGVENSDGSITAENVQIGEFGLRGRN